MATTQDFPAIETRALQKQFGTVHALAGLDLTVTRGSIFGFLGPNGSGKTTALSIFAGLARASGGAARICGLDVATDGMAVRERIGFLRQDPRFYGWMTGKETLEFTGRFFPLDAPQVRRRTEELLELVDLAGVAGRKIGGYSGGMRQRLGIAQALMGNPEVLLLDEPCSALDPAGRFEVIQIMERLRGSTTVFYSTHILQDVERVADEVAIINAGMCLRQSRISELLAASQTELVVELEGDAEVVATDLRRQPYVVSVSTEKGQGSLRRIRVEVRDLRAARCQVPNVVVAHDEVIFISCRPEQPDLEAVFLELTGGASGDIQAA
ncbi:MAG: ABC transporter ATP-binding protein [Tepidiformaceae bacterium]